MVKQSTGKIINVASDISDHRIRSSFLAYALSKASVYALTQSLAAALVHPVLCKCYRPGIPPQSQFNMRGRNKHLKECRRTIYQRREERQMWLYGVFLASKDSDFITGQLIFVNGGHILL